MHRTLNTLRLIVIGMALALAVLATPAAQAQSVKGLGTVVTFNAGYLFDVDLYTRQDGTVRGSFRFSSASTGKETWSVETLTVTGNLAIVWARGRKDKTLHAFYFIDNWDGSGPDQFAWDGGHSDGSLSWLPLYSGDVTVTP